MRVPLLLTLLILGALACAPAAFAQGDCDYNDSNTCPPTAALSASPNPAYQGQVVVLDGSGSSDPDGDLSNFRWDIDGNGSYETDTGPDRRVATAFFTLGANPIGLRVADAGGRSDVARGAVQVAFNPLLAPDRTPPSVRLSRISRSLRRALHRGIAVRLRCSEACVMGAGGTIQRSTSRRFGIRGRRRNLSKPHRAVIQAGSRRLVLKFSRTARRRLRRARSARVTLRFAVTDPSGNKRRVRRSLRLRR
ncbi:MAG TPA: PKD domain-containing protein [Thermoleophilaceae bacterium]|nr:PKD domain-containing protein [Thermoleophilaceae bacterium]